MINSLSSAALARQPALSSTVSPVVSPVAFIFISSVSPVYSIKNYEIDNYELIEMQVYLLFKIVDALKCSKLVML